MKPTYNNHSTFIFHGRTLERPEPQDAYSREELDAWIGDRTDEHMLRITDSEIVLQKQIIDKTKGATTFSMVSSSLTTIDVK